MDIGPFTHQDLQETKTIVAGDTRRRKSNRTLRSHLKNVSEHSSFEWDLIITYVPLTAKFESDKMCQVKGVKRLKRPQCFILIDSFRCSVSDVCVDAFKIFENY